MRASRTGRSTTWRSHRARSCAEATSIWRACWRSAISVRTDFKGSLALGIDCLFVTAGIHAEELGDRNDPDLVALQAMFAEAGELPKAVTLRLAW